MTHNKWSRMHCSNNAGGDGSECVRYAGSSGHDCRATTDCRSSCNRPLLLLNRRLLRNRPGGKKLIAIITASLDNPFFVTMAETAKKHAEELGYDDFGGLAQRRCQHAEQPDRHRYLEGCGRDHPGQRGR